MTRKQTETDRRHALNAAPPERRAQTLDDWLQVATAAEVRRYWRAWMGMMPGWAAELHHTARPRRARGDAMTRKQTGYAPIPADWTPLPDTVAQHRADNDGVLVALDG
ncbi:MAG: hypothetical protein ABIL09_29845, partial [Gemmatimonadota bacterium]